MRRWPELMKLLHSSGYEKEVWIANDITKREWMDLYADLYRQTHGENETAITIYADAMKRIGTLKANGLL